MTSQNPNAGSILTEAYQYWIKTLPYQLLFTVIYFFVIMFVGAYAFRYYGLFDEVNRFSQLMYTDFGAFIKKYEALMQTENAISFSMAILVIKAIIFPLNIGFLKIYRKIDLGEVVVVSDLFAGFSGHYFFIFGLYAFVWNFVSSSFLNFFPPLGLLWIGLLLLVPSFVFFKDYNIFQAIKLSGRVFQKNVILILLLSLASILISYSGLIVFFLGIFVTFPFWNALIFVLYKRLVGDY